MENTRAEAQSVWTLFPGNGAERGDVRCVLCTETPRTHTVVACHTGSVRTDRTKRKTWSTGASRLQGEDRQFQAYERVDKVDRKTVENFAKFIHY